MRGRERGGIEEERKGGEQKRGERGGEGEKRQKGERGSNTYKQHIKEYFFYVTNFNSI